MLLCLDVARVGLAQWPKVSLVARMLVAKLMFGSGDYMLRAILGYIYLVTAGRSEQGHWPAHGQRGVSMLGRSFRVGMLCECDVLRSVFS